MAYENWVQAGWAEAAAGMALVTSIMRAQQIMLSEVERVLRPFGLTFARYEVLMLLHFSRSGALPVGKIGQRLQVHPASVTNAVARLETDQLVRRTPNPQDRRSVLAELTDAGRIRALEATEALNNDVFEPAGSLSSAQAAPSDQGLFGGLRELRRRYDEFD